MPIDRETSLRRAEKLLRQGRLDAAIEEYRQIVDEHPADWSTANLLGDLYARSGQVERAAEQFNRVADHLGREGFLSKAGALYRKVLKIAPENDHALLQSADIAGRQGLLADARAALAAVADRRGRRGDRRGTAEIVLRMAALEPGDLTLALQAARAAADVEDRARVLERFRTVAAALAARGKVAESLDTLIEAITLEPGDAATRTSLVDALLGAGDLDRARQHALDATQLKAVAAALAAAGREDDSQATLAEALRLDPGDDEARGRLLRSLLACGHWAEARRQLPADAAGRADFALMAAEIEMCAGRIAEARTIVDRALAAGSVTEEAVGRLAGDFAGNDPEAAFALVDLMTSRAVGADDWPRAAGMLRRFLGAVPGHVAALSRLVEVSVDGDLEDSLSAAQADLAEAYLVAGRSAEARVIAEDLVTREPSERGHVERLRRILVDLGEDDPDRVIADRLSAVTLLSDPYADLQAAAGETEQGDPFADVPAATGGAAQGDPFAGFPAATGGVEQSEPTAAGPDRAGGEDEAIEIDLSDVLGDLPLGAGGIGVEPMAAPAAGGAGRDLDGVFEDFRQEVIRDRSAEAAEQYYKLGVMYLNSGLVDQAIEALNLAARAPRHRFEAAALLGRVHRERGELREAIEWFERAAEAPAASSSAGHALLYDLGDVLEHAGERERAHAVFIELQADAGAFRDVSARIDRLRE